MTMAELKTREKATFSLPSKSFIFKYSTQQYCLYCIVFFSSNFLATINWRPSKQSSLTLSYQGPAKILSPFLPTAPLQFVPKIQFIQATIDGLTNNKTKNALHKEPVILNHFGGDPISHSLSNSPFVNVLE